MLNKLLFTPILDTFYTVTVTVKYLNYYKYILANALFLPVTFFILFAIVGQYYEIHSLISVLIMLVLLMKNVVVVHRILILGKGSVDRFSFFKLKKRELNYLSFQVITIMIVMIVPIIILTVTSNFLNKTTWPNNSVEQAISIFQWIGYYLVARISLLFPLLAIDKKKTLVELWKLTTQYKLLLFSVVAVIPFIITSILQLVLQSYHYHWLSMFTLLLVSLFTASILSVAYIRICEEQ